MQPPLLLALLAISTANVAERRKRQTTNCEYTTRDSSYSLKWHMEGNNVAFDLETNVDGTSPHWTGVGFGARMEEGDFLVIKSNNGAVTMTDYYTDGSVSPKEDATNGGQNSGVGFSGSVTNGRLSASFSRPLDTGDSHDASLSPCIEFMIPEKGGPMRDNGDIQMHDENPIVTGKICPAQCAGQTNQGGEQSGGQPFPGANGAGLPPLPPGTNGQVGTPLTAVGPGPAINPQTGLPFGQSGTGGQINPQTGLPFGGQPQPTNTGGQGTGNLGFPFGTGSQPIQPMQPQTGGEINPQTGLPFGQTNQPFQPNQPSQPFQPSQPMNTGQINGQTGLPFGQGPQPSQPNIGFPSQPINQGNFGSSQQAPLSMSF